jgi:hypothetical protein
MLIIHQSSGPAQLRCMMSMNDTTAMLPKLVQEGQAVAGHHSFAKQLSKSGAVVSNCHRASIPWMGTKHWRASHQECNLENITANFQPYLRS